MTRSIQALESALGVQLFHRHREGVELTEFGQILVQKSATVVLAAKDIEREIQLTQALELGTLVLGVGPYFGAAIAGLLTARLHEKYPRLGIKLVLAPWKDFPALLRARKVDLVLAHLSELRAAPDFEFVALPKLKLHWVCRTGHPLTHLSHLRTSDLTAYALASPSLPQAMVEALRSYVEPGLPEEWLKRGLPAIECDSSAILISLIKNSNALTMMHRFMIKDEVARGELAILADLSDRTPLEYGIAWFGGRTLSHGGKALLEIALQTDLSD